MSRNRTWRRVVRVLGLAAVIVLPLAVANATPEETAAPWAARHIPADPPAQRTAAVRPSAQRATAPAEPKFEVVPQIPHTQHVAAVAFSPDGTLALSGSRDNTLKLWDVSSGRLLRTFEGHINRIESIAFSPDGNQVLSGAADNTLKLWDTATGQLLRTFYGHSQVVLSVAFAPDGRTVLSGSDDKTLKLWDASTGELIRTFEGHSQGVTAVAVSSDGKRALSGSSDNTLKLWDIASGQPVKTLSGHTRRVLSVAFAPNGRRALSSSSDKTLKVWNLASGQAANTLKITTGWMNSASFSPSGRQAIAGGDTIRLWDVASGQLVKSFKGHIGNVESVVMSPDGKQVLSGATDRALKLWDTASGQLLKTFEGHSVAVETVAFSPDGRQVLAGRGNNAIELWDAKTGQLAAVFKGHTGAVRAAAFTSDGAGVVSASNDNTLKLWDAITGEPIHSFTGHGYRVTSLAFTRDGQRLLSGSLDRTVKLWETATGQLLKTFTDPGGGVEAVAISPDGRLAVSGSVDRTLKVWDVESGQIVKTLKGHTLAIKSVTFSTDGSKLLSAANTVTLWDIATGRAIKTFKGHSERIYSAAFSPDGRHIVSGGFDNTVKVWDASSGALLKTLKGHSGPVKSVAYSYNGTQIISGSEDTTTRIWDAATGKELVRMLTTPTGEWLAMTPAGFFDASDGGLGMLSVVRGPVIYSIEQFRDQLQRKDLVQAVLTGDPLRLYEDAVSKLNLQKIVDSGPAPTVELFEDGIERAEDSVRIKVRLFNNEGGGIGERLIWRVNGKTQGQTEPPELKDRDGSGDPVVVTQALRFDPARENTVIVTAYNKAGLLSSTPLVIRIDKYGATPASEPRPRMFILAVGVNGYTEPALTPLKLAVNDVQSLARSIKLVAEAGGYENAAIVERVEADATREKIATAFADIAAQAGRQDTLIVLLAGHGKSTAGRYYYLPHNTRFGNGRNLTTEGIPTELWQRWIASVQVERKLLIIDTCESSGAVTMIRGSATELARETAVEHIQRSLGESVITAAREVAYEASGLGHGVLTYAVLDALSRSPEHGGLIKVKDIDAFVVREVPRLSEQLSGLRQEPFDKIVGDFPVGAPKPEAGPGKREAAPVQQGRYILFSREPVAVRGKPEADAEVVMQLKAPAEIQVFEFRDNWVLIGRGGSKLGYVPSDIVQKMEE